jgi:hypothetical protein
MARLLNLLHVVGLFLSLSFAASQPDFEGRVITESGSPLRSATVLLVRKGGGDVELGILSQTDEAGVFHLKTTPDALFVQKEGYLASALSRGWPSRKPVGCDESCCRAWDCFTPAVFRFHADVEDPASWTKWPHCHPRKDKNKSISRSRCQVYRDLLSGEKPPDHHVRFRWRFSWLPSCRCVGRNE